MPCCGSQNIVFVRYTVEQVGRISLPMKGFAAVLLGFLLKTVRSGLCYAKSIGSTQESSHSLLGKNVNSQTKLGLTNDP